jgi:hypothetical protein
MPAAVVEGATAAASSFLGQAARKRLSQRLPAPVVAVGEDALAITLAVVATS